MCVWYRTLPAKSAAEEKRHQKLYDEMVTAARRKGELIHVCVCVCVCVCVF